MFSQQQDSQHVAPTYRRSSDTFSRGSPVQRPLLSKSLRRGIAHISTRSLSPFPPCSQPASLTRPHPRHHEEHEEAVAGVVVVQILLENSLRRRNRCVNASDFRLLQVLLENSLRLREKVEKTTCSRGGKASMAVISSVVPKEERASLRSFLVLSLLFFFFHNSKYTPFPPPSQESPSFYPPSPSATTYHQKT